MQNAAAVRTLQACRLALLPTLANIVRSSSGSKQTRLIPYSRRVGVFVPQSAVSRCAGGTVDLARQCSALVNVMPGSQG